MLQSAALYADGALTSPPFIMPTDCHLGPVLNTSPFPCLCTVFHHPWPEMLGSKAAHPLPHGSLQVGASCDLVLPVQTMGESLVRHRLHLACLVLHGVPTPP